jgi:uncharacterized protein involved in outer membrane biogenesis
MKKFLTILLVVVVVIVIVLFAKDLIIKTGVEKGVALVTGLKLNIGSLKVGILKPIIDIKDLNLFNPASFPDRTMVDMPEIYVNYDLPAIIGGKIHLPELRLALKEFIVVKNAQGELNLDALKTVQAQKEGKSPAEKGAGRAPAIKIDALMLSIGKVIYKDYSKGTPPKVKEFNLNLNESYTNVDNPYSLASLIIVRALMYTSIAALTNFDLKGLQGTVGGVLGSAQKAVSTAASTAQEVGKQATDTIKGLLKNPFGSGK